MIPGFSQVWLRTKFAMANFVFSSYTCSLLFYLQHMAFSKYEIRHRVNVMSIMD